MWVRTLSFIFLFILRLRFPPSKSIATTIRVRYDDATVKGIRKFERLDFKIRKVILDINFLETCIEKGVILKFLHFRTANHEMKSSKTYKNCQLLFLTEEVNNKKSKLENLKLSSEKLKSELQGILSYFDFLYVVSLFLDCNKLAIEKIQIKQNIKLLNLIDSDEGEHDPIKLIYNYSSYNLSHDQESILMKGLNFGLQPNKLKYEDYMINFELLFKDVNKLGLSSEDTLFVKNDLKNIAFSSYKNFNRSDHEFEKLKRGTYCIS